MHSFPSERMIFSRVRDGNSFRLPLSLLPLPFTPSASTEVHHLLSPFHSRLLPLSLILSASTPHLLLPLPFSPSLPSTVYPFYLRSQSYFLPLPFAPSTSTTNHPVFAFHSPIYPFCLHSHFRVPFSPSSRAPQRADRATCFWRLKRERR